MWTTNGIDIIIRHREAVEVGCEKAVRGKYCNKVVTVTLYLRYTRISHMDGNID